MNNVKVDIAELVARLDETMSSLTRRSAIRRLYSQLASIAGAPLERPSYLVLKQLVSDGPRRITDLAAEHGVEPSTMSRHTRALEEAGFVVKLSDPGDGRVALAEATKSGRRVVERFEAARNELLTAVLSGWGTDDAERFVELFERFNTDISDLLDRR